MRRRPARPATASSLAAVARALGFRSVELVTVTSGVGGTTAEVTGVLHRCPRTVPVSLAAATRLVGAGAPLQLDGGSGRRVSA